MKKSSFSTFLLPSLAVLSLASYIFLSTAAASPVDSRFAKQGPAIEMEEQADKKVLLPDVTLVKRLINITKIVLPRD
ncbi:MAG: hypothetical protein IPN76_15970 [Saprospiraceae bacterium]|jgi:hypothetical protein|nr:hypothetical protein [Saprospiraceae bacterium]